eukprot:GHVU01029619.1.p1 GENE.GHVU01029619.1~~GHVU01029619.1.p1  ORF type:complete len:149 (+),score=7.62 GHVU01029619.1:105-551(+)
MMKFLYFTHCIKRVHHTVHKRTLLSKSLGFLHGKQTLQGDPDPWNPKGPWDPRGNRNPWDSKGIRCPWDFKDNRYPWNSKGNKGKHENVACSQAGKQSSSRQACTQLAAQQQYMQTVRQQSSRHPGSRVLPGRSHFVPFLTSAWEVAS